MQDNRVDPHFKDGSYFEEVISLYNFDRHFRLIVFNAIERVEIALPTKMIYHLAHSYGAGWYLNSSLFPHRKYFGKFQAQIHEELLKSSEEFIMKQDEAL